MGWGGGSDWAIVHPYLGIQDRFIDFGSGEGFHLFEAAKQVKEAVGIDVSSFQMAKAKKHLRPLDNVHLIEAEFSNLVLPPGLFTKGFSRRALHHLDDKGKSLFFAKIGPSFTAGALFLLEDIIRFPGWQDALADFRKDRSGSKSMVPDCILQDTGEEFPTDVQVLEMAFADGGFQVLSCEQESPFYGRILAQRAVPAPPP